MDEEDKEEDAVFSSRLKSVLLNAPKELSRAMFDFASSAFAFDDDEYAHEKNHIESHDDDEEEEEEERRRRRTRRKRSRTKIIAAARAVATVYYVIERRRG